MVCPIGGAADTIVAIIMVTSARNNVCIVRDQYRLLKRLVLDMGVLLF
jgi:hypothetical protein